MARAKNNYESNLDMTPMIDCVFQLMIFFIVTFKLETDQINDKIVLAKSPHGPAIEKKSPGLMIIEVDKKGQVTIGRMPLSDAWLYTIVKQAVNRIGPSNVDVLIRADRETHHAAVRRVMDRCTEAGVWRIKFAALKRKGS
jgi:biopolymer transport protein ExbD